MESERAPLLTADGSEMPAAPQTWRAWAAANSKNIVLVIYVVGFILTASGNSVYFKKVLTNLNNYPFFSTQVIAILFLPIFVIPAVGIYFFTNNITRDMLAAKYIIAFAIMGLLDGIAGWAMVYGGNNTSGTLQPILMQGVIPFTMLFSVIFLKSKYTLAHMVGAAVILLGVGIALLPSVVCHTPGGGSPNSIIWNIVFFASNIPMAISTVYKEYQFAAVEIDVWYLQAWDQVFMMITMIATLPSTFFIPPIIKPDQLGPQLLDGFKCFTGKNVLTSGCNVTQLGMFAASSLLSHALNKTNTSHPFDYGPHFLCSTSNGHMPPTVNCDHCSGTWLNTCIYLCFNLFYNIFGLLVVKHGSATLFSLANTVRLPLANLAFAVPFIMGKWVEPMSWENIAGLGVTLAGIVVYRLLPNWLKKKPAPGSAEEAAEAEAEQNPHIFLPGMGLDLPPLPVPVLSVAKRSNVKYVRRSYFNKLGLETGPPEPDDDNVINP